jgi:hypothetical protein
MLYSYEMQCSVMTAWTGVRDFGRGSGSGGRMEYRYLLSLLFSLPYTVGYRTVLYVFVSTE